MIKIKKVPVNDRKYCTHCDDRAWWMLLACNPKIVQQSITACFCNKCYNNLKKAIREFVTKPCPRCKGRKYLIDSFTRMEEECPHCEGKGKV